MIDEKNFDCIDLQNAIFEKSEQLVNAVSLLNGSRLELLSYFGDSVRADDKFHAWLVGVSVSRVCDGISDLTILCNEIFDILQEVDRYITNTRGKTDDT